VPEAAAEATQAFGKPVVFLTGGTDKGLDLSPVADAISKNTAFKPSSIYMLEGSASDKMICDFNRANISFNGPFKNLDEMLRSLKTDILSKNCSGEKVVVFSPGSTSFGMFTNEFDRGNQFKEKVREIFI